MRRAAISLLLVLATGVSVWLQQRFAYVGLREHLEAEIGDGRHRVAEEEATAARLDEFRDEAIGVEVELHPLQAALPSFYELVYFLSRLEDCGRATGVAIKGLDVGQAVKREGYHETLVSLSVAGREAAVGEWLRRVREGRCPFDLSGPLYSAATGRPVRLVHVFGNVRYGDETELGLTLFSTEEPAPAVWSPAPSQPEPTIWLPPYVEVIRSLRTDLAPVQQRLGGLQVIGKQMDDLTRKRQRIASLQALVEKLKAAEPELAQGRARLADHHWLAGRFDKAVACYRAALPAPDGLVADTGFFQNGKLYVREAGAGEASQTAHLIAIDPARGRVAERYPLPGFVRSFTRRGSDMEIACAASPTDAGTAVSFGPRGFERPLLPLAALALRKALRGYSMGLASWFLAPAEPSVAARADERRFGSPPRSLLEIERALREAARQDPTNPWLPFLHGAAAFLQGREPDARAAWEPLFRDGFPHVAYYEFSSMADSLERLGLRSWADRAYEEALRRRHRIDVPVDATSWVGRFYNAPFLYSASGAGAGADLERRYVWLGRARELTGIGLPNDDLAARAWERHFTARGDRQKAAVERAFFERAQWHPLNPKPLQAAFEGAFCGLAAAVLGFWAVLAACWRRAGMRVPFGLLADPGRTASLTASAVVLLAGSCYVHVANLASERNFEWRLGDRPTTQPGNPDGLSALTRWTLLGERIRSIPTDSGPDNDAVLLRVKALGAAQAALISSFPLALTLIFVLLLGRRGVSVTASTAEGGIDWLSRWVQTLVPGSFDLLRGALVRGYVAFAAFVYVAVALLFFDAGSPASSLLDPHLSWSFAWHSGLVLPGPPGGRAQHWALVGSLTAVRRLWASIVAAAMVCAVLHLMKLPDVWRLPRVDSGASRPVLPRWLRAAGAILLGCQLAGLGGLWLAGNLTSFFEVPETIGLVAMVTFLLGLTLSLLWSPAALVTLYVRRAARPGPREVAQLAVLSLEAFALATLLALS